MNTIPSRFRILLFAVFVLTSFGFWALNIRTGFTLQPRVISSNPVWNVARSLVQGEGYSNPFGYRSGGTAWVAPVAPTIIAMVLVCCESDSDAAVVFFCMHCLSICYTFWLVLREIRTGPLLALFTMVLFTMVANVSPLLEPTYDGWIYLFIVNITWDFLSRNTLREWNWPKWLGWSFFTGIGMLSNPVLGYLIFTATCFELVPLRLRGGIACNLVQARLLALICVPIIVCAPWTARNYCLNARFIPVKSNFAFELWLANCKDQDGILDGESFEHLPFSGLSKQLYLDHGEVLFVDKCKREAIEQIAADPFNYLKRCLNRAFACLQLLFLGGAALIFLSPAERDRKILRLCAIYVAPYIAISYYERYHFPFSGLILIVYARMLFKLSIAYKKTI